MIRNPWGQKEWSGDFSDKSPLWTKRLKSELGFVDADECVFLAPNLFLIMTHILA